ncbi:hypothetical protein CGRA01v4_03359 [Colletotrichum graminicola]|nr:hypothetical protein CGRA01v4_03359 [Colletotrichum graminicola]
MSEVSGTTRCWLMDVVARGRSRGRGSVQRRASPRGGTAVLASCARGGDHPLASPSLPLAEPNQQDPSFCLMMSGRAALRACSTGMQASRRQHHCKRRQANHVPGTCLSRAEPLFTQLAFYPFRRQAMLHGTVTCKSATADG